MGVWIFLADLHIITTYYKVARRRGLLEEKKREIYIVEYSLYIDQRCMCI